MYILYILTASNGTRIHSSISYCMFQVCNTNFNTVRMKYLGVKSLQLHHIGFILRESSKCEEKGAGRTFVCFLGRNYLSWFRKQQWHPQHFQKAWWEQRMALTCTEEHLKKKKREKISTAWKQATEKCLQKQVSKWPSSLLDTPENV